LNTYFVEENSLFVFKCLQFEKFAPYMQPLKETLVGHDVWLTAEEIKPKKIPIVQSKLECVMTIGKYKTTWHEPDH